MAKKMYTLLSRFETKMLKKLNLLLCVSMAKETSRDLFTMSRGLQGIGFDLPWLCRGLGIQHVLHNSNHIDQWQPEKLRY